MKRCEVDRSKVSPMMRQYLDIKDAYEDSIIFFRWVTFMKCSLMMPLRSHVN